MQKLKTQFEPNYCAVYTRKSTSEGLDMDFSSVDAQREAGEAYIKSQKSKEWIPVEDKYDDGGYTGADMERPALKRLMKDIEKKKVNTVVVYKVDRLSRSLLDFARLMEFLEKHNAHFVSVTQQFDTSASLGRLTLNILLSFAQFERELISERTRDKIAATRRKGKWSGGTPILGFDIVPEGGRIEINEYEADLVREIFGLYLELKGLGKTIVELNARGIVNKKWIAKNGNVRGGSPFSKNSLHRLLTNLLYIGKITYKDEVHKGEHEAIVDKDIFQRVQNILQRNGNTCKTRLPHGSIAMLRGLFYCGVCGSVMCHTFTTKVNKRYRYYTCLKNMEQGKNACTTKYVPANEAEQYIIDQVRCMGRDRELIAQAVREAQIDAQKRIEDIELQKYVLTPQLEGLYKSLEAALTKSRSGKTENEEIAKIQGRIEELERQCTNLNEEILALRADMVTEKEVLQFCAELDPVWDILSTREQVHILNQLIKRIEYDPERGILKMIYHPTCIRALSDELERRKGKGEEEE